MKRRLGWWVGAALMATASGTVAEPRPNIVFCFADDWGRHAGCYAALDDRPSINELLKTPVIDRLAREGVIFRNAFVNAPSCTPCRSALLAGRYFWQTGRGAILQGAVWDPSIPAYPLLLREAGYHIGQTYKVWSPGTPNDAPYGGTEHEYERAGRRYNQFSQNATRLVKAGRTFEEAKAELLAEVRENFRQYLADRKPGQPLCYWFGPTLTHREFERDSGRALWGIDPDRLRGRLPAFLPDVPEVRMDMADYMGEIQAWDAGVGVIVEELERIGELDRTVIVLSGDHGMPGVPRGKCNLYDFGVAVALIVRGPGIPGGRVVDDFVNLMDLAPTFLEIGGVSPPPGMTARSVWPVLSSAKSGLVDSTRTWVVTGRERHVAGAREGNLPYPHRALRTKDFLYVRNFAPDRWPMGMPGAELDAGRTPPLDALEHNTFICYADMDASPTKAWLVMHRQDPTWARYIDLAFGRRPAEELYDLRGDPDQIRNVAEDPSYSAVKAEMSRRLMQILREQNDPRVTDDGGMFERPPFTDPVEPPPRARPPKHAAGGARRAGGGQ